MNSWLGGSLGCIALFSSAVAMGAEAQLPKPLEPGTQWKITIQPLGKSETSATSSVRVRKAKNGVEYYKTWSPDNFIQYFYLEKATVILRSIPGGERVSINGPIMSSSSAAEFPELMWISSAKQTKEEIEGREVLAFRGDVHRSGDFGFASGRIPEEHGITYAAVALFDPVSARPLALEVAGQRWTYAFSPLSSEIEIPIQIQTQLDKWLQEVSTLKLQSSRLP